MLKNSKQFELYLVEKLANKNVTMGEENATNHFI